MAKSRWLFEAFLRKRDERDGRDDSEIGYHGNLPALPALSTLSTLSTLSALSLIAKFSFQFSLYLLGEGCRYNARQKKYGWAVLWRTAHSYLFLLAAVDVCLITRNYQKLVFVSALFSIESGRFGKKSKPVHSSTWSTDTV